MRSCLHDTLFLIHHHNDSPFLYSEQFTNHFPDLRLPIRYSLVSILSLLVAVLTSLVATLTCLVATLTSLVAFLVATLTF